MLVQGRQQQPLLLVPQTAQERLRRPQAVPQINHRLLLRAWSGHRRRGHLLVLQQLVQGQRRQPLVLQITLLRQAGRQRHRISHRRSRQVRPARRRGCRQRALRVRRIGRQERVSAWFDAMTRRRRTRSNPDMLAHIELDRFLGHTYRLKASHCVTIVGGRMGRLPRSMPRCRPPTRYCIRISNAAVRGLRMWIHAPENCDAHGWGHSRSQRLTVTPTALGRLHPLQLQPARRSARRTRARARRPDTVDRVRER